MQINFTAGNIDIALTIMREAAQWLADTQNPMWDINTLTRERINNPPDEFLVAWLGSESAACCLLSYEDPLFWPDIPAGTSGFLHKIAVRRKFAGQGIAMRLIEHAQELCRMKNITMLRLDTDLHRPKLCALYEGMGFQRTGERRMHLPEDTGGHCDVALYEKELRSL